MHRCYIALGSNLYDPILQIMEAYKALVKLPHTQLMSVSSFYRSVPLGPILQPDFVNAVAEIQTLLSPSALLHALLTIEKDQGRERKQKWGPRVIDLDLLLYDQLVCKEEGLTLPHPELYYRNFVLIPLSEIYLDCVFPDGTVLKDYLKTVSYEGITKMEVESFPLSLC